MSDGPSRSDADTYVLADSPEWEALIAERTVDGPWSAFFLPHLRPGMSLLDCGCGPGSITQGFAKAVAPGQVVGVDVQAQQVDSARTLAKSQGVANVRFEEGSVYELPFEEGSFDSVFAAQVLFHLNDPVKALMEMRRILKPGGIIGIADSDAGAFVMWPSSPLLEEMRELELGALRHHGSDPFMARRHRQLLMEAGFARTEASVAAAGGGSDDLLRRFAAVRRARFLASTTQNTALEQGWADRQKLDEMLAELLKWCQRPDAFYSNTFCRAIGWKDQNK